VGACSHGREAAENGYAVSDTGRGRSGSRSQRHRVPPFFERLPLHL